MLCMCQLIQLSFLHAKKRELFNILKAFFSLIAFSPHTLFLLGYKQSCHISFVIMRLLYFTVISTLVNRVSHCSMSLYIWY